MLSKDTGWPSGQAGQRSELEGPCHCRKASKPERTRGVPTYIASYSVAPAKPSLHPAPLPLPSTTGLVARVRGTGGSSHQPTLLASATSTWLLLIRLGSRKLESGVPPSG